MKIVFALLVFGIMNTALAHESSTRDLMTRITKIECTGDKKIELIWDSAASPMGPIVQKINGENPRTITRMGIELDGTSSYEWDGFKISFTEKEKKSKKFQKTATLNGKDISLNCTQDETMKFLRKRVLEHSDTAVAPNSNGTATSDKSKEVKTNN